MTLNEKMYNQGIIIDWQWCDGIFRKLVQNNQRSFLCGMRNGIRAIAICSQKTQIHIQIRKRDIHFDNQQYRVCGT